MGPGALGRTAEGRGQHIGLPSLAHVGPLRGREPEMAELDRLIASAEGGEGGLALIEGPPGIGKTRLLAEAVGSAARRRLVVASSIADELDQITPWGPLLGALTSSAPPVVSRDELMSLSGLIDGRLEVLERIRVALEDAARARPLAVVIDDLQWADPSTLQALGSLTLQLFSYPIVWLLCRRPFPASGQMAALIDRLSTQETVRLPLAPLSAEAAAGLAGDLLGRRLDQDDRSLVARAEGNPLYVVEILRSIAATAPAGGRDGSAVRSLASAVLDHLRSMSDEGRRLIMVASVLGPSFSVVELAEVVDQPASELLGPLGEALSADVLVEDGARLAFRHDLFRQAVYDDIPEALRLALHRDAARSLRELGAPVTRLATHLAIGAVRGDESAVEVLVQAVGELFATSPSAAADLAIRVTDLVGDEDPRRPAFLATAVQMLGWTGRVDEARALGEVYIAQNELPIVLEAQVELGMRRAWLMHTGRRYPAELPQRLVTDPGVPAAVRADLIVVDQNRAILDRPAAEVGPALAHAAELVRLDGDAIDVAFVQSIRLGLDQEQGNLLRALEIAEAPLPGFPDPPDRAAAIRDSNIASCLATVGRPREALEMLARALAAASSSGQTIIAARSHSTRAMVLLELGQIDDARAEGQAAAELAETLGFSYYLGQALVTVVGAALHQGHLADARAAADWLIARCPGEPMGDDIWAAALCADAEGRPDDARQALAPMVDRLAEGRFVCVDWYPARLPQLVGIALRAQAPDQAEVAARAASEIARRNPGLPSAIGSWLHAEGLLRGNAASLRQAVETFAPQERPLATAAAREDLGRVLATDDHEQAIEQLEAAYDAYARMGVIRDTARVRAALRALGVRKRRVGVARPEHGWESLTKSERVVVELVARGLTNREAANELFLSPDTINAHLKHAFSKLNIRSRVQLARLVAERELTSTASG